MTLLTEYEGLVVGRLAVLVNHVNNCKYNERRGFFEWVNDAAVAGGLFETGQE